MIIEVVADIDGFAALRGEWNDLLSRSSADTIFLTWEWLFSWWESYSGIGDTPHIVAVRESSGELIGIVPLFTQSKRYLPFRPMKMLRFIGDGSADSDYLDAILLQGRENEILASVWGWLGQRRASWDLLQLFGVPENSPTYGWLKRAEGDGIIVSRSESIPCLVASLPHSWDEYLTSLKPRFRTKVRSVLRDLTVDSAFRFYTVQTDMELKQGLQNLYELHGKRWELKGTQGVFRNPAKRHFYERFTRLFLARGWLAFDFLELNGRPVACQMCFRYGGTQFLLQEGFDPQFASDSVGIGLRALAFKKAIEDGIRHYDFLAGQGRHKTQWQTDLKHCKTISFGSNTLNNRLYLKFPTLVEALRERVKTMLPEKLLEARRRLAAS